MDDLSLLIDLHIDGERQGPGSDACTQKALQLAGFSRDQPLRIADLGCGTGASAMVLAEELHALTDGQISAETVMRRLPQAWVVTPAAGQSVRTTVVSDAF